jgi:hypothetical protein
METAQLTWSKRMKKSASSAMMSGWGTAPHQLKTTSRYRKALDRACWKVAK